MAKLNTVDAAFLRMESPRTPMHVSALLTFKIPPKAGPDYLGNLFTFMRSRPAITPPFCWRLVPHRSPWLSRKWESDDLDMDYHLRHSALPFPGGERELGILVARLHSNPLDLNRPLWECHLIEGLQGGRFAFVLKAHHAAMDGMGALRLIRGWLSEDPEFENFSGPWAVPEADAEPVAAPRPSLWASAKTQAEAAPQLAKAMYEMARRDRNPDGGLLSALSVPRSMFNAPLSPQRRLATQRYELSRFKAIGAASGATVNDVCLAVIGGAIRSYLKQLNALPRASLIASIPVGVARTARSGGNAVAGFVCPLGTDVPEPVERLRRIQSVTSRTKQNLQHLSPAAMHQFTLIGFSPLVFGQWTGLLSLLPPIFNVAISNVVGSKAKLYFRGAELEALYPASVLFDGHALNVTVVGYVDHLCIGITGCREAVPHVQRLAVLCGEALAELEAAFTAPKKRKPKVAQA